jgi:ribosomal protein S18 acetylase RimI-like enzyme
LKDGSEVFVAEKNGGVIGFIVLKTEHNYVYIDNIHVIKSEQGKGVGRTLVTHVENIAAAKGCRLIRTDTTETGKWFLGNHGFWTRMGYKDTGERLPTQWGFKIIPFAKRLE